MNFIEKSVVRSSFKNLWAAFLPSLQRSIHVQRTVFYNKFLKDGLVVKQSNKMYHGGMFLAPCIACIPKYTQSNLPLIVLTYLSFREKKALWRLILSSHGPWRFIGTSLTYKNFEYLKVTIWGPIRPDILTCSHEILFI